MRTLSSDHDYSHRVRQLAGEDGHISKQDFIKHLKYSKYFLKSFDKNDDGILTEVRILGTFSELLFSDL